MTISTIPPRIVAIDYDPFNGPHIEYVSTATKPQLDIWLSSIGDSNMNHSNVNESGSVEIAGFLDKSVVELALQTLTHRNSRLRSVFSADGKHICLLTQIPVHYTYQDVSRDTIERQKKRIAATLSLEVKRRFDLVQGPLFRTVLIKISDNEHQLTIVAHRLILDDWPINALIGDVLGLLSQNSTIQYPPKIEHLHNPSLHQPTAQPFAHRPAEEVVRTHLNQSTFTSDKPVDNSGDRVAGRRVYPKEDVGHGGDDGKVLHTEWLDHPIKIRGYRIELEEVEAALRTMEAIREAVVVLREDRPGDQRLVGYVILNDRSSSNTSMPFAKTDVASVGQIQGWKHHIRQILPEYMIPEELVVLAALPLTFNGKIDRNALPKPAVGEVEYQTGNGSPRTNEEKVVADVWRETLGIDKVSIYDNFFEVGGHSLRAVQLMVRLEARTGKRLPAATLFEHSTIEKVAKLLLLEDKPQNWSSLVLLKPGGSKRPLYIVHGANSQVLQFNTLAMNMDLEQPVYGLQAKGINEIDEPLTTIEDMASHYISEIIASNPDGPFALAGFSFGGTIAYEMSKQLKAMGKDVNLLAMLDAYAFPINKHKSRLKKAISFMQYRLNSLLFFFQLLLKNPHGAIEYKMTPMKRRLTKLLRFIERGEERKSASSHEYSMKLYHIYEHAVHNYRLLPHQVKIDLFRAKVRREYSRDLKFLGWRPFALNGIQVHEVPGEHGTLFEEENVKELARSLQNALNNRQ